MGAVEGVNPNAGVLEPELRVFDVAEVGHPLFVPSLVALQALARYQLLVDIGLSDGG